MVFCGKPSKGCAPCRAKRTKCDTKRPSCTQCLRAGRSCLGYRDPSTLVFRNHTSDSTDVSFQVPQSSNTTLVDIRTTRSSPEMMISDESWSLASIPPSLYDSLESQATCFFFKNYVWEDSQYSRSYFDYLPGIFVAQEPVNAALQNVIISLGLVGLSNARRTLDIMISAKEKYTLAIRATNSALRDVDEAKCDQTLITVMLLGLYETNTCNTPRSMKLWTQHTHGAVELLRLRGKEQLQTRIGHQLFVHLRNQVIANCIQRRAPIPEYFIEWTRFTLNFETGGEFVASSLSLIIFRFCNLRGSMDSFRDYRNSAAIIDNGVGIDAQLEDWAAACSLQYDYSTVRVKERSASVFSNYYHIYQDIWVAHMWNLYRSIRILLNEMMLEQLIHLSQSPWEQRNQDSIDEYITSPYEEQITFCRSLLVQLPWDICASVPYYLEHHHQPQFSEAEVSSGPKAAGGNILLWPLYVAACTHVVSDAMRMWVIGRLEKMAEVMGIRQARVLAHLLSVREDPPELKIIDLDMTEDMDVDE